MKKTWAFLGLLLISIAAYAALDWEIPNNVMKMGDGSNATAKSFEMRMGLGASNPILSSSNGTEMNVNIPFRVQGALNIEGAGTFQGDVTMGDGTTVDRTLLVNRGGSNPFLRWDESAGAWIFSNDGTLEKKIGSGSGGGSGGINLLLNPSFEDPGAPILNWSNNGGTLTQEDHTNGREGNLKFARFVTTIAAQYVESDAVTISDDIGPGCMADVKYSQGDNAFSYKVLKSPFVDPTDVVAEGSISDLTSFIKSPTVTFPCSGGDQFKLRIVSTAAGTVDLDEAYLGSNKGFVDGSSQNRAEITFDGTVAGTNPPVTSNSDKIVSVTRNGTGDYNVNYAPGAFTIGPAVTGSCNGKDYLEVTATSPTTSNFRCVSDGGGVEDDTLINLFVAAQGVDAIQTQEAFTPEQVDFYIDAEVSGLNVQLNAGTANYTEAHNSGLTLITSRGSANIACFGTNPAVGSTCPSSNESVGLSFSNTVSGDHEVCAEFTHNNQTDPTYFNFARVNNASVTRIQDSQFRAYTQNSTSGGGAFVRICGVHNLDVVGEHTFKLFYQHAAGTNGNIWTGQAGGDADSNLRFTVRLISHNVSRPIINNMVDTSNKKGIRLEACRINNNGTATIDTGSGLCESWIDSVITEATGYVEATIKTGIFAKVPICVCMGKGQSDSGSAGQGVICESQATDNTNTVIRFTTRQNAPNSAQNEDFFVHCIGER